MWVRSGQQRAERARRSGRRAVSLHGDDGVHKIEPRAEMLVQIDEHSGKVHGVGIAIMILRFDCAGDRTEKILRRGRQGEHAVALELAEADDGIRIVQIGRISNVLCHARIRQVGLPLGKVPVERAARLLNDHALHGLAGALGDCLRDQIHLAVFAAERYEDRAVDIRVGRIARHDIHGKLLVDRDLRAALLIVEGYGAFDLLGNDACRIRGAHARGKDKYLVPHADAPVRTAIAVKCHIMLPFLFFSAPVFLHAHDVVNVNMRTGRNECCCLSDVLAVFYDRLALCDVANGELVVDGDVLRDRNGHRLAAQEKHRGLPCCDRFYGDSNVIFCINNHCICHFVIFLLSRSCSAGTYGFMWKSGALRSCGAEPPFRATAPHSPAG